MIWVFHRMRRIDRFLWRVLGAYISPFYVFQYGNRSARKQSSLIHPSCIPKRKQISDLLKRVRKFCTLSLNPGYLRGNFVIRGQQADVYSHHHFLDRQEYVRLGHAGPASTGRSCMHNQLLNHWPNQCRHFPSFWKAVHCLPLCHPPTDVCTKL